MSIFQQALKRISTCVSAYQSEILTKNILGVKRTKRSEIKMAGQGLCSVTADGNEIVLMYCENLISISS